jgi:hypothetical protein
LGSAHLKLVVTRQLIGRASIKIGSYSPTHWASIY